MTTATKQTARILLIQRYASHIKTHATFCVQFKYNAKTAATNFNKIIIDEKRVNNGKWSWDCKVKSRLPATEDSYTFANFEKAITLKGNANVYLVGLLNDECIIISGNLKRRA